MEDPTDRLDRELREVAAELQLVKDRLSRLEEKVLPDTQEAAARAHAPARLIRDSAGESAVERATITGVLGGVGRTFLVLCGAFLLRSLTDSGLLPLSGGVVLGLVYAAAWVVLADRSAGANHGLSAVLAGVAATVIAYPLVWEAATTFALLKAPAATTVLALFTALALAVAWRRDLEVLAWFVIAAALVTDLAIMLTYRNWGSGAAVPILLGGATVWLASSRRWTTLRWPVAAVVDLVPLMVLSAALASGKPGVPEGPSASLVLAVLAVFVTVYVAGFALQTLHQGRDVGGFEAVQTLACVVIGLTGATAVTRHQGLDTGPVGWAALAVGMVCYGVGFAFVDRRLGRRRTFIYYTSLALVLLVWGLLVVADDATAGAVLYALGVVAAALGSRFDRMTLRTHSAVFVTVAAAAGGIGARAAQALMLPVTEAPRGLEGGAALLAVTSAGCYLLITGTRNGTAGGWPSRIPACALAVLAVAGSATFSLQLSFQFLGRTSAVDPPAVAVVRTAVLSLSVIALAGLGTRPRLLELKWMVYPLLACTAAKLLLEDLRRGRPLTLFLAFAVFGIALIVAPRLHRKSAAPRATSNGVL
jgi:hypothetical protein